MLFVLDDSTLECLRFKPPSSPERNALDYIAHSAWEGKHRLTAPIKTLNGLLKLENSHFKTKRVIADAIKSSSDDMTLQGVLPIVGVVKATTSTTNVSRSVDGRIIEFPLLWFDDSSKVQASILLGENLVDAEIMEFIASTLLQLRKLDGEASPPIKARRMHGGGRTIDTVLEERHREQEFTFCLVDSDREHPNGSLGGTAEAVRRFSDPLHYPLMQIEKTRGRELENILPDKFYEEIDSQDVNHAHFLKALKKLKAQDHLERRLFLDIKKGMTVSDILRWKNDRSHAGFWDAALRSISCEIGFSLDNNECLRNGRCGLPDQCRCRLISRHSQNLLQLFLEKYINRSVRKIARDLDEPFRNSWEELCKCVMAWCCARDRVRS